MSPWTILKYRSRWCWLARRLFVLLVTTLIGSFRAKEENWLSLQNSRSPKPAQPNLLIRTCPMARAVDVYLAKNAVPAPRAQPVLLCANSHMFVECVRSMARVIMSDTICCELIF